VSTESKTSRRRVAAAERKRQALELRKSGATYAQIRDAVGYRSTASAYQAVVSALRELTREPAEEVLRLELARLDRLLLAVWPRAIQGDDRAIRSAVAVLERRAKLLGLDAPARVELEPVRVVTVRLFEEAHQDVVDGVAEDVGQALLTDGAEG
jgi:hypothetical protein